MLSPVLRKFDHGRSSRMSRQLLRNSIGKPGWAPKLSVRQSVNK